MCIFASTKKFQGGTDGLEKETFYQNAAEGLCHLAEAGKRSGDFYKGAPDGADHLLHFFRPAVFLREELLVIDYHQWLGTRYRKSFWLAVRTGIWYGILFAFFIILVGVTAFLVAWLRQ